ncbi:hypothetical protein EHW99_2920 [Erwinia amylovora]|uniref:Uncharacterized protein n=3 Tax=Erwinia amylovora TaxID=552 RepID=A0A831A1G6_ERWAM|nr:hypothetical protein EaACW_0661 [Erwinia amylovora ACW56400]QJQ55619.1 hypothetical protein EHX00_2920 [Erwinia amylovora]CBA19607.1 hypothetical protein predicted by Glimmer/Critica [Erwinia amylovora CFBP1430]CBX79508.1 hypothetical protein predicted by Glimmer/Critica [Erwinia amylovora ATCC BAA-2158]CCO77511.1 hypothetical protein BN432_0680 [Erwinia amylovora Ea356]CCO81293.1 hypothetical protein BN433_0688 [Erwinia amylovora Ea266]CCO85100.1 hypothetical protein BN434_0679 [Erwinia a
MPDNWWQSSSKGKGQQGIGDRHTGPSFHGSAARQRVQYYKPCAISVKLRGYI